MRWFCAVLAGVSLSASAMDTWRYRDSSWHWHGATSFEDAHSRAMTNLINGGSYMNGVFGFGSLELVWAPGGVTNVTLYFNCSSNHGGGVWNYNVYFWDPSWSPTARNWGGSWNATTDDAGEWFTNTFLAAGNVALSEGLLPKGSARRGRVGILTSGFSPSGSLLCYGLGFFLVMAIFGSALRLRA